MKIRYKHFSALLAVWAMVGISTGSFAQDFPQENSDVAAAKAELIAALNLVQESANQDATYALPFRTNAELENLPAQETQDGEFFSVEARARFLFPPDQVN